MSDETTSIKVMAKLADIPIEIREVCDSWLLLTYDIPHNKEGDRVRHKFLIKARYLGATQHTASCYFMPWSLEAEGAALDIASIGSACVWSRAQVSQDQAKAITKKYDKGLEDVLDEIGGRLDRIALNLSNNRLKTASKMADKTMDMLVSISPAVIRRGSAGLYIYLTLLERRLSMFV